MARAWSGYVDSLAGGSISNYTRHVMHGYTMGEPFGNMPDFLAAGLCLAYAMLLALGVKCSATVNSLLTIVNLCVMGLVIGLGIAYAKFSNWSAENGGFLPYGFGGVLAGIPQPAHLSAIACIIARTCFSCTNRRCDVLLRVRGFRLYRHFRRRGTRPRLQHPAGDASLNGDSNYRIRDG